jgi:hypothetical protein
MNAATGDAGRGEATWLVWPADIFSYRIIVALLV